MTAHKITVSKGSLNGEVSAQWASRPDDQKFLSLGALRAQVAQWADESHVEEFNPAKLRFVTNPEDPYFLEMAMGDGKSYEMTNYGFDQVAGLAGAPAGYLRKLPAPLAAANLRYGLLSGGDDLKAAYVRENGVNSLRAITSTNYGRILDRDVVDVVQSFAGDGTGDTRWKVPGMIDWGSMTYNSEVDITTETTTLYASDRDIFLFLVDDRNPIEVGKLPGGEPDLMFRGVYVWNSEVGRRSFGVASMYLRGVCQNRNLWGVEGFSEVTFRHTSGAPERFLSEAAPALTTFADGAASKLVTGVKAAKAAIVSTDDDERLTFLAKFGFSEKQARELISISVAEEGKPQESIWDHAQAITAKARRVGRQENRLLLEGVAGKMLDKVTA